MRIKIALHLIEWGYRLAPSLRPIDIGMSGGITGGSFSVPSDAPGKYELHGYMARSNGRGVEMREAVQIVTVGPARPTDSAL